MGNVHYFDSVGLYFPRDLSETGPTHDPLVPPRSPSRTVRRRPSTDRRGEGPTMDPEFDTPSFDFRSENGTTLRDKGKTRKSGLSKVKRVERYFFFNRGKIRCPTGKGDKTTARTLQFEKRLPLYISITILVLSSGSEGLVFKNYCI